MTYRHTLFVTFSDTGQIWYEPWICLGHMTIIAESGWFVYPRFVYPAKSGKFYGFRNVFWWFGVVRCGGLANKNVTKKNIMGLKWRKVEDSGGLSTFKRGLRNVWRAKPPYHKTPILSNHHISNPHIPISTYLYVPYTAYTIDLVVCQVF